MATTLKEMSKSISIRMDLELMKKVNAMRGDLTVAQWIRRAVREYIKGGK
jgi:predicted DNA-binding protein